MKKSRDFCHKSRRLDSNDSIQFYGFRRCYLIFSNEVLEILECHVEGPIHISHELMLHSDIEIIH